MKNLILRLFLLQVLLSACGGNTDQSKTDGGSQPQSLMRTYAEAPAAPVPGFDSCDTYPGKEHRICYRTLLRLTQGFIRKFPDDATRNGLGGYMSKESLLAALNANEGNNGIRFTTGYFNDSYKNESYLAYEGYYVEDKKNIPCDLTKADFYRMSTSQFLYTASDTTLAAISEYLSTQPEPMEPMTTYQVGETIKTNADNFLTHFVTGGTQANQRTCFFFVKDELLDLLNQEGCVGARFLWGFDAERTVDKVRILLVGVDENGNNLLVKPGTTDQEADFRESAWPPAD